MTASVFGRLASVRQTRQDRKKRGRRKFVPGEGNRLIERMEERVLLSGVETVTSATGGVTTVGSLPWAVENATTGTTIDFASTVTYCEVSVDMSIPAQNVTINGQGSGPNGQNEVIQSDHQGALFTVGSVAQDAWFQGLTIEYASNKVGSAAIVYTGTTYGTIEAVSFLDDIGGSVAILGADDDLNMSQVSFSGDLNCADGDVYDGDTDGGNLNITGFTETRDSGTSQAGASFFGANLTQNANVVVQEGSVTGNNIGFAFQVNLAPTAFACNVTVNLIDFQSCDGAFSDTSAAAAGNASRVTFAGDDVTGSSNAAVGGAVSIAASGATTIGGDNIYNNAVSSGIVVNGGAASQVTAYIWQDSLAHNNNKSTGTGGAISATTNYDTQVQVVDCTVDYNQAAKGGGICWTPLTGGQTNNLLLVSDTIAYDTATSTGGGVDVNGNSGVLYSDNTIYAYNSAPTGPDVSGMVMSSYDLWDNTAGASINGTNDSFGEANFAPSQILRGAPGDPYGTLPLGTSFPVYSNSPAAVGGDPALANYGFPFSLDMNQVSRQGTAVIGAVVTLITQGAPHSGKPGGAPALDAVFDGTIADLFPVGASTHKSTIVD